MANPDRPIQTLNPEQAKNPELPPDIQNIMGFQNPRLKEYEALAKHEELYNDMSGMDTTYTHNWYDEHLPLPAMPEKDKLILRRTLLDFYCVQGQQSQLLATINSGDASRIFEPLLTYEELVRQYWHGKDHKFELATILKESDSETVDEFNKIIATFNANLARIQEENDVEAVRNCHQEIEKLLRRELKYDTKITEAFFHKKLEGKILVDCGGRYGSMAAFAKKFGVKTYINVDKHSNAEGQIWVRESEGMTKIDCGMDMLRFLAQLQPGSVSITINGIDSNLIPNPDYHAALAREIERVVAEDGIVFGANSTALKMVSENYVFDLDAIMAGKPPRLNLVVSKAGDDYYGELRIFTAESVKKALGA